MNQTGPNQSRTWRTFYTILRPENGAHRSYKKRSTIKILLKFHRSYRLISSIILFLFHARSTNAEGYTCYILLEFDCSVIRTGNKSPKRPWTTISSYCTHCALPGTPSYWILDTSFLLSILLILYATSGTTLTVSFSVPSDTSETTLNYAMLILYVLHRTYTIRMRRTYSPK